MIPNYLKNIISVIYHGPLQLRLNPTGIACNYDCPMCDNSVEEGGFLSIDKNIMSLDHYIYLLNNLPFSIRNIEISGGGEPLLYKNIDVLLKAIKQKWIRGSLITNGSLLTPELSQTLINCRWNSIRISLNSSTIDTFKKVNGCDYFYVVMNNIKSLIKQRENKRLPKISLHFVIQKFNYFEVLEYFKLANSLGVDKAMLDTLIVSDSNKYLLLSDSENQEVLQLLQKAKKISRVDNNIENVLKLIKYDMYTSEDTSRREYLTDKYCAIVQSQLEVRSNGLVIPCCMAHDLANPSLNIKSKDIKMIWKEYEGFRKNLARGKFYSFCISRCNYQMPLRK